MGRSRYTIHIDAPPEDVWRVLSKPERRPEFEMAVTEVRDVTGPIDQVGTRWIEVRQFPARGRALTKFDCKFQVAKFEALRLLELHWEQGPGGQMIVRHITEPEDGGTRKIVETEYELPGGRVGELIDKLVVHRFLGRHPRESNVRLKALVEAEARGTARDESPSKGIPDYLRSREPIMTFLKGILLAIAMNGVFMVLVPFLLVAVAPEIYVLPLGGLITVGYVVLALGALFTLWCVFAFIFEGKGTPAPFDAPKKLVVKGLYRFVRNPMYVGNMLIVIGETLAFQSTNMLLYTVFVFVMMNVSVLGKEEPDLRKIFGDSYVRYCKHVPRWIPRLTPAQLQ